MKRIYVFLSLIILSSFANAGGICDRSELVSRAIVEKIKKSINVNAYLDTGFKCDYVTPKQLLTISQLDLRYDGHAFKPNDFSGLDNLKSLQLLMKRSVINFPKDLLPLLPQLTELSVKFHGFSSDDDYKGSDKELVSRVFEMPDASYFKTLKKLSVTGNVISLTTPEDRANGRPEKWTETYVHLNEALVCSQLENLSLSDVVLSETDNIILNSSKALDKILGIGNCYGNSPSLKSLGLFNITSNWDGIGSVSSQALVENLMLQAINNNIDARNNNFLSLVEALPKLKHLQLVGAYGSNKITLQNLNLETVETKDFHNTELMISNCSNLKTIKISDPGARLSLSDLSNFEEILIDPYSGFDLLNLKNLPRFNFQESIVFSPVIETKLGRLTLDGLNFKTNVLDLQGHRLLGVKILNMEGITRMNLSNNIIQDIPTTYGNSIPTTLSEINICDNPLRNPDAIWNLIKFYPAGANFKIKVTTPQGCGYLN